MVSVEVDKKDVFLTSLKKVKELLRSRKNFSELKSNAKELSDILDISDKKISNLKQNPPRDDSPLSMIILHHYDCVEALSKLRRFFTYIDGFENYPESQEDSYKLKRFESFFDKFITFYDINYNKFYKQ